MLRVGLPFVIRLVLCMTLPVLCEFGSSSAGAFLRRPFDLESTADPKSLCSSSEPVSGLLALTDSAPEVALSSVRLASVPRVFLVRIGLVRRSADGRGE